MTESTMTSTTKHFTSKQPESTLSRISKIMTTGSSESISSISSKQSEGTKITSMRSISSMLSITPGQTETATYASISHTSSIIFTVVTSTTVLTSISKQTGNKSLNSLVNFSVILKKLICSH